MKWRTINAWLRAADISISPFLASTGVDASDRQLRRYFTRQSLPARGPLVRRILAVPDQRGATKPHPHQPQTGGGSGLRPMAPRILYGLAGAKPPKDDVYRLLGLENQRKGVKKVFNAVLFAEKRLTRFPPRHEGSVPQLDQDRRCDRTSGESTPNSEASVLYRRGSSAPVHRE